MVKFNLKIQDGSRRHLGFSCYVNKKNVNNSGLNKDICIKFYGITYWTLAYNNNSYKKQLLKETTLRTKIDGGPS